MKINKSNEPEPHVDEKRMQEVDSDNDLIMHRSVVDAVTVRLRREILTGKIKPGERIFPGIVAKRFGVSQTPIREALRCLETQGLVVTIRRATFTTTLSTQDIEGIYDMRRIIEGEAARRSVSNQTDEDVKRVKQAWWALQSSATEPYSREFWHNHREFHWSIYAAGGSAWMRRLLDELWQEVERYVTIAISNLGEFANAEHFKATMHDHADMFNYFINQDADGLHASIMQHLTRTVEAIRDSIEQMAT